VDAGEAAIQDVTGPARALLITGPAGSGKSTLGQRVASGLGWKYISEDEYWVRKSWGHGLRTEEQEADVQREVVRDLLAVHRSGQGAVLEFVLYKRPPNPLTEYQKALRSGSVNFITVALKSSVDEILRRMQVRGRPNDLAALESRRRSAENEVGALERMDSAVVIDPTGLSPDELYGWTVELIRGQASERGSAS
jgi:gluconate kinase